MHTLYGPWSVAFSMPATPNERLPQVLGPPSAISLSLSAGTWEMFRCTPLPIPDHKKPEDYVRLSLSGHNVSAFLFFCLCHSEGAPDSLWLVGFPDSHSGWRRVRLCLWITYYLTPLPITRKKFPSQSTQCHIQPSLFPSALPTSSVYRWNKWSPER